MKALLYLVSVLLVVTAIRCKPSSGVTVADPIHKDSVLVNKYSTLLNVSRQEILKSFTLYRFIDRWESSANIKELSEQSFSNFTFAKKLFNEVYGRVLSANYDELRMSERVSKFTDRKYLKEGDILFFEEIKDDEALLTHVGVYLHNTKFVTWSERENKAAIRDLNASYWNQNYKFAGRLK